MRGIMDEAWDTTLSQSDLALGGPEARSQDDSGDWRSPLPMAEEVELISRRRNARRGQYSYRWKDQ
jgi:hypothetical protein